MCGECLEVTRISVRYWTQEENACMIFFVMAWTFAYLKRNELGDIEGIRKDKEETRSFSCISLKRGIDGWCWILVALSIWYWDVGRSQFDSFRFLHE